MNDFSGGWNFREILAKWKVWQNVVIFWGKCVQSFRYWVNENVIKKYWWQYGDYVWGEICKNGIKNARDNCKSKNLRHLFLYSCYTCCTWSFDSNKIDTFRWGKLIENMIKFIFVYQRIYIYKRLWSMEWYSFVNYWILRVVLKDPTECQMRSTWNVC